MELLVFDNSGFPAGVIDSFEYLRWTRRYSACGDFELRAIASQENLEILKMGYILCKSDDEEAGYIEYVELTMEEQQEFILVLGRFATSILTRRIVWGTENLRGDISEAVKQLLTNHFLAPSDNKRTVSRYDYSAPVLDVDINTQVSYRNLMTVIEALCEPADIGFKTVFNRKARRFSFMLYRGELSQAVFSKDYENLNAQTYIQSLLDYANVALIGGEGDGPDREMAAVGGDSGEARREIFVDAKDLRKDAFGKEYPAALKQRGQIKLAEHEAVLAFDAAINPHGNMKYKKDFDLGQLVRVASLKWGVILTTRITEIEENYDRDGVTLQVVFGRGLLTLNQKLKGGI